MSLAKRTRGESSNEVLPISLSGKSPFSDFFIPHYSSNILEFGTFLSNLDKVQTTTSQTKETHQVNEDSFYSPRTWSDTQQTWVTLDKTLYTII